MADKCEVCCGRRDGVLGNENVVEGIVMCDYCHADAILAETNKCATCGNTVIPGFVGCDCDTIKPEEFATMTLRRGKYIGDDPADKDKTALIKWHGNGNLEVQFDDTDHLKAYGWHPYPEHQWELFPEPTDSVRVG